MKTTIDIADALLRRAKRLAAERDTTLKMIVEEALRDAIEREESREAPVLSQLRTFKGDGLQPGLSWGDWGSIRDLLYEGRGA